MVTITRRFFLIFLVTEAVSSWIGYRHKQPTRLEILCPELQQPRHGTVSCLYQGARIPCHQKMRIGTVADYECDKYFVPDPTQITECSWNGTWSSPAPTCIPECGKQNSFVSLIMNGAVATPGMFPWQTAIYNYLHGAYEFWCGGSLISEYAVITAAHCVWKIPENNLIVVFGKFSRDFSVEEENIQKMKVARVEMLRSYQDVGGNYNGDLSVVFVKRAVVINNMVRPICLDWKQEHMDRQLIDGNLGTVLGWGLTENDTFSEVLKSVQLPVKSDEICIAQQHKDFRKFITYTSFCAGYRNGSGVCNGDSGGGLAFIHKKSDTWYLQGVVSVSPRRRGTSLCDPNFYTVFTKVSVFVKWLMKMKILEKELIDSKLIQENVDTSGGNEISDNVKRRINFFSGRLENVQVTSSKTVTPEIAEETSLPTKIPLKTT